MFARRLALALVTTAVATLAFMLFIAGAAGPARSGGISFNNGRGDDDDSELQRDDRVQVGLSISPVPLNFGNRGRGRVGLGSYLVNAVGGCNDCHTCPSYEPGNSPYSSGQGRVNALNFLAGGVQFGPFTSRNITPDASGRPAGLTEDGFVNAIRTGHDSEPPHDLLQVMPWPVYRHMTDRDLRAIYAYLSSIPHAVPGICAGAGQMNR